MPPQEPEHDTDMPRIDIRPARGQAHRIRSVDGLRALGLLLVFGFHTWEFAGRPALGPVSAVIAQNTRPDLFIVLTGFVLYLPFALDPGRVKRFRTSVYLRRRFRRIIPTYYVALMVPLALPYVLKTGYRLVGGSPNAETLPSWTDVVTHLTFTHLFFPNSWDSINGSLWTMSLEMQLYLIFPIVLLLYARFRVRALTVMLLTSFAYWAIGVAFLNNSFPTQFLWSATALGRLMELLAGVVAADIAMTCRTKQRRIPRLTLASSILATYLLATEVRIPDGGILPYLPLRNALLGLTFGSLVVLVVATPRVGAVFAIRPLSTLGYMAYSIFLIHQPVAWYVNLLLRRVAGMESGTPLLMALWTVGFVVVLASGWLLHVAVERPCIRWSQALVIPPPAAVSAPDRAGEIADNIVTTEREPVR